MMNKKCTEHLHSSEVFPIKGNSLRINLFCKMLIFSKTCLNSDNGLPTAAFANTDSFIQKLHCEERPPAQRDKQQSVLGDQSASDLD